MIQNLEEAEDFLFKTVPKTSSAIISGAEGLQKSARFFSALDNPQDSTKPFHIAATSGKGTIAHLIEAMLIEHNFTVVTLTSPHVYSVLERVRINGHNISEDKFVSFLNQLIPVFRDFENKNDAPSYFEVNTAVGFLAAKEIEADYVVVETGLGGLLDTTNTIDRSDKINVLGQIGFDHTHILGNSLPEIAAQKAGIITGPQLIVALQQKPIVNDVFSKIAGQKQAELHMTNPEETRKKINNLSLINPRLSGAHQYGNCAVAMKAVEIAANRDDWPLKEEALQDGLAKVELPGRFELRQHKNRTFIYDGAHNRQKLSALFDAIEQQYPGAEFGLVFATGQKHDADSLLNLIHEKSGEIITTEYHSEALDMYRPAQDLSQPAKKIGATHIQTPGGVASRIMKSNKKFWVVTGSFYGLNDLRDSIEKS